MTRAKIVHLSVCVANP